MSCKRTRSQGSECKRNFTCEKRRIFIVLAPWFRHQRQLPNHNQMVVMIRTGLGAAALAAAVLFASSPAAVAHDWPLRHWLERLLRPDNDKYPERRLDRKSLFCCGEADIVKTKFKVERTDARHPEDEWYAWLNGAWTLIPSEKILDEYAPDGEAHLFVLGGTIQCFVRPKGGS